MDMYNNLAKACDISIVGDSALEVLALTVRSAIFEMDEPEVWIWYHTTFKSALGNLSKGQRVIFSSFLETYDCDSCDHLVDLINS